MLPSSKPAICLSDLFNPKRNIVQSRLHIMLLNKPDHIPQLCSCPSRMPCTVQWLDKAAIIETGSAVPLTNPAAPTAPSIRTALIDPVIVASPTNVDNYIKAASVRCQLARRRAPFWYRLMINDILCAEMPQPLCFPLTQTRGNQVSTSSDSKLQNRNALSRLFLAQPPE